MKLIDFTQVKNIFIACGKTDMRRQIDGLATTILQENDMIQTTKNGRLYNISFKLNEQTRANQYRDNFKPKLSLEELMDLETREWLI